MHIIIKLHKFDDKNLKLKAAEVLKDKNDSRLLVRNNTIQETVEQQHL